MVFPTFTYNLLYLFLQRMMQLQEEQTLPHLYNTWWKEKQGGGCDEKDKSKKDKASALGMANVGGVFLVGSFETGVRKLKIF